MVDRIGGSGSSLARAAIEAALARQSEAARKAASLPEAASPAAAAQAGATARAAEPATGFARSLSEGLRAIDGQVAAADRLAEDVVTGKISDFHEAAAVLKQSELSLRFALEVRNKFVDAYREIMRMSV